ncbi:MAG: hypothetical protein U0869_07040 [Chloroflexota bacterium]
MIPSLAAFAVLRPIFGLPLTAVIPLATYTLLILYRNIVAGLRPCRRRSTRAAIGMGYSTGPACGAWSCRSRCH